jgi:hypothetical protein
MSTKYVKLAIAAGAVWYLFFRGKSLTGSGSAEPQGKINQPQPGVVRGAG